MGIGQNYIPLFYSNPLAEAHWDEKAYQVHHEEWVQCAKNAIKKG